MGELYRCDWASTADRRRFESIVGELIAPGFESRLGWRWGGQWRNGGEELRALRESLEHDFEHFTFDLSGLESADRRVVAAGDFHGTARVSQFDVGGSFRHTWTFAGGLATGVRD